MKTRNFIITLLAIVTLAFASEVNAQRYPSQFVKSKLNTVQFSWTVGEGLAADTTKLSASADYSPFYWAGPEDLYVTSLNAVLRSGVNTLGTDTLSVQICFSDTAFDATPTYLNTTAFVVQDTLLGTSDTSFDNELIPAESYLWLELGAITTGRKPAQVLVGLEAVKQD